MKKRKNKPISIFQEDAPTRTARKPRAEQLSVFDHGVSRADQQQNETSAVASSSTSWATSTAANAVSQQQMSYPISMQSGRGSYSNISRGFQSSAHGMVAPPMPQSLQATVGTWNPLGGATLDPRAFSRALRQQNVQHPALAGRPMRRTRSGTLEGVASTANFGASSTAPALHACGLPPVPLLPMQQGLLPQGPISQPPLAGVSMRRTRSKALDEPAPPPVPMMPSLSEAALAIGLDMHEATDQLDALGMVRTRSSLRSSVPSPARLPPAPPFQPSTSLPPPLGEPDVAGEPASQPDVHEGLPMRRTRSQGLQAMPPLAASRSVSDLLDTCLAD